jgi:hypothetical protein
MKFTVSQSVKGSLVIPNINGTFKANSEVDLTEEQVKNPEIQNIIKMGLLTGENLTMEEVFTEYKNLSGFTLNFSWGQYVKPKQNFYVDNKHVGGEEIKSFIKENLISRIVVEKAKPNAKTLTNNKAATKTKTTVATVKKAAAKKDGDSKINIKDIAKDPESLKDVLANQKVPANVHIHEPKKDSEEAAKVPADIINQDLLEEKDTVQFVDKQQKKEKITKLQKVIQEKTIAGKAQ